ncbi:MAG: TPM domain-containing protein [Nanoarchaeota archaeon]|mgnify:CR=1 FL=1
MKKLLIILILILVINVNAREFPQAYDKHVNDFAKIFNETEINILKDNLNILEQNTSAEVVIVTVESTEPLSPAQYRTELFNKWGIGNKEKDNGLLILYSVKEKRIEVETGYGLEGILPDSKLGRLLDDFYVPYRDKNQTNMGIILFTNEVSKVIIGEGGNEVSSSNNNFNLNWIIILIFVLFIIFSIARKIPKSTKRFCKKHNLEMTYLGIAGGYAIYKCAKGHEERIRDIPRIIGGFSGGGLGGGGFGGGGFGGGSSGGGGAGR